MVSDDFSKITTIRKLKLSNPNVSNPLANHGYLPTPMDTRVGALLAGRLLAGAAPADA